MATEFILATAEKCIGCHTCEAACATEHAFDEELSASNLTPRLKVVKSLAISVPVMCRQCENAPCAQSCPQQALIIGERFIEPISSRCIGCKSCVVACPFGAIEVVTKSAINGTASSSSIYKCDLCQHRPQGPACVQMCPTKALKLVSVSTLQQEQLIKQKKTVLDSVVLHSL